MAKGRNFSRFDSRGISPTPGFDFFDSRSLPEAPLPQAAHRSAAPRPAPGLGRGGRPSTTPGGRAGRPRALRAKGGRPPAALRGGGRGATALRRAALARYRPAPTRPARSTGETLGGGGLAASGGGASAVRGASLRRAPPLAMARAARPPPAGPPGRGCPVVAGGGRRGELPPVPPHPHSPPAGRRRLSVPVPAPRSDVLGAGEGRGYETGGDGSEARGRRAAGLRGL